MIIPRFKRWKLWTPNDLSPLAWYDAKDGTYITQSGGLVSQWDDKSGNGRHIAQSNDPEKPTYASDTVSFDGIAQYLFNSSPFMYANGNISVSFVGAVNADAGDADSRFLAESQTGSNATLYCFEQHNTDASQMCAFIRNDANVNFFNHNPLSATGAFNNTKRLYVWGDTGSRMMGNFNGGALTHVSYTRSGVLTLTRFTMAAIVRAAITWWMDCDINEVIITNFMDKSTRECMEGWLAWRWGLEGSLPANHRFKGEPPRVPLD